MDDWVDLEDLGDLTVRAKPAEPKKHLDTDLYQRLNAVANNRLEQYASPIFITDLNHRQLYSDFQNALPEDMKQVYNCNSCRGFVRRYGGLVVVDDEGSVKPLLWDPTDLEIDPVFRSSIDAVARQFEGRRVFREYKVVELTNTKMKSSCEKGGFNHMYLSMLDSRISRGSPKEFAPTATKELATMLGAVIKTYRLDTVREVTQILEQDKLPQADNHKAAARWLLDLLENDKIKGGGASDSVARHNLGYRYAASAFTGCVSQVKNGVLSNLLEWIENNESWKTIEKKWNEQTHPLQYLRPQAAPKAGNIAASERLFKALCITENDLRRRFLVFNDIPKDVVMWQADPDTASKNTAPHKLFANVTPKISTTKSSRSGTRDLPPTQITFTKLMKSMLPTAKKLEYKLSTNDGLYFFITGFPGTKPLMQWHFDDNDNRASWMVYHNPFPVKEHGLKPNEWNEVGAIIPFPHLWDGGDSTTSLPLPNEIALSKVKGSESNPTQGKTQQGLKWYHAKNGFRYLMTFPGIYNTHTSHLSLFSTLLKGEFHGARSTIEAYSDKGNKEFVEDVQSKGGYVGGVEFASDMGKRGGDKTKHLIRVTDKRGVVGVYEVVLFE